MYHTCGDRINMYKEILACDVGWSILDVAFSPDDRHIAYSSWSESRKYITFRAIMQQAFFVFFYIFDSLSSFSPWMQKLGLRKAAVKPDRSAILRVLNSIFTRWQRNSQWRQQWIYLHI